MNTSLKTSSSHPSTKVVGTATVWEEWISLKNKDLSETCHWVELRLDALPESISIDEILEYRPSTPLLFTARAPEEGGVRPMDQATRFSLLERTLPHAAAIDVEISQMEKARELIGSAKRSFVKVIASFHDFTQTPELHELIDRERQARTLGADLVKFAFKLHKPEDILTGVRLLAQKSGDMAVMGMGAMGPTSRLLYAQCGSSLIYGYLGQYEAAPGQWPAGSFMKAVAALETVPCF